MHGTYYRLQQIISISTRPWHNMAGQARVSLLNIVCNAVCAGAQQHMVCARASPRSFEREQVACHLCSDLGETEAICKVSAYLG